MLFHELRRGESPPKSPDNIVPITPDARTVAEKFGAEHDRELLTILFTDLLDSTKLQSELGNVDAARLTELIVVEYSFEEIGRRQPPRGAVDPRGPKFRENSHQSATSSTQHPLFPDS